MPFLLPFTADTEPPKRRPVVAQKPPAQLGRRPRSRRVVPLPPPPPPGPRRVGEIRDITWEWHLRDRMMRAQRAATE